MFSGIVERDGEIVALVPTTAGRRLRIRADGYWRDAAPGASIAVDGVCLTVTKVDGNVAEFDVVAETLSRTTLGGARPGGRVNLEKSMPAGGRVDGHFVQGHVEGVARVLRVEERPGESKWWFQPPAALSAYILSKGSIAIDGISLTVVDARQDAFSVVLVPTTIRVTTLARKRPGDTVNIETDVIVRAVVHTVEAVLAGKLQPAVLAAHRAVTY